MLLIRRPALTDMQKKVYDQLFVGFRKHGEEIVIQCECTTDDVYAAYYALLYDHYELFWLGSSYSTRHATSGTNKQITLLAEFCVPKDEIDQYQNAIDGEVRAFLSTVPLEASSYERVKRAYEYVVFRTDYDKEAENGQNLLGVFKDKRSVCAGYAEAFCYLLSIMNVPCACVTGPVTKKTGTSRHEWALVRIDGTYTYVDPTWGDPFSDDDKSDDESNGITYRYLCVTRDELFRSHSLDEGQAIPMCVSQKYDWFIRNGQFMESYEFDWFDSLLHDAVLRNEKKLEVKFANRAAYDGARKHLGSKEFYSGRFGEALKAEAKPGEKYGYSYSHHDRMRTVTVSW